MMMIQWWWWWWCWWYSREPTLQTCSAKLTHVCSFHRQTSALESPSDEAAQKSFYAMLRAFGHSWLLPNATPEMDRIRASASWTRKNIGLKKSHIGRITQNHKSSACSIMWVHWISKGQYMDPALLPNVSRGSFSRLFKAVRCSLLCFNLL